MEHLPIITLQYVLSHRISIDALNSMSFHLQRYTNSLSHVPLVALEKSICPPTPSGLYNAHFMCLVSKQMDFTHNRIQMVHAQLLEMPLNRGVAPKQHLVRFDCPVFNKQGT
jgi:hypothetical protein